MIVQRKSNETWERTVHRYAKYAGVDGVAAQMVYRDHLQLGYEERRAAYLTLAGLGFDGAEEESARI